MFGSKLTKSLPRRPRTVRPLPLKLRTFFIKPPLPFRNLPRYFRNIFAMLVNGRSHSENSRDYSDNKSNYNTKHLVLSQFAEYGYYHNVAVLLIFLYLIVVVLLWLLEFLGEHTRYKKQGKLPGLILLLV